MTEEKNRSTVTAIVTFVLLNLMISHKIGRDNQSRSLGRVRQLNPSPQDSLSVSGSPNRLARD